MDTVVPILGAVKGPNSTAIYPPVMSDDLGEARGHGPAPQWYDDSDDTYGTCIWHGYVDVDNAGMWTTIYCDIAPVKVPLIVSGLTVRVRARVRPMSPSEFSAWVGPPAYNDGEVVFAVYNMNPVDSYGQPNAVAAYSRPKGGGRFSSFFNWTPSWEPSWQEAYLPAYRWDWMEQAWDPELGVWVDTVPQPTAKTHLSDALRYGARVVVSAPNEAAVYGVYDEKWVDVYEVRIVAHSPSISGSPSGDRRAFKGVRR